MNLKTFSPVTCSNVLSEVLAERERQEKLWGQQNHAGHEYLMILGEEVGEANKEYLEEYFPTKAELHEGVQYIPDFSNYRKELIQVAAVAVAMIECLDRNGK